MKCIRVWRENEVKKIFIIFILILCIFGWYSYISFIDGTRFTAIAAAKAQSSVGRDAIVFDQIDLSWGKVFLLNTPNGERTAVVRKKGPLWFSNAVTTFDHVNTSDPVRTVGWLNYQYTGVTPPEEIALIAVLTNDPQVALIEVGEGTERVKKQIKLNKPLLIWWPKAFIGSSLKPIALSSEGKPLYEYRFAQGM
ncbi:hypothetical protein D3C87_1205810 [compost metagenome]